MKKISLTLLASQIKRCKACKLWKTRTNAVPGEGLAHARIMLIGEAPGAEEARQGRPFVGRAGKTLDKLLEQNNIKREKIFITNIVKCRPPQNRKPRPDEIKACLPYLKQQIQAIKPKLIVLLGDVATSTLLGKVKLSKIHGQLFKINNIIYIPTYHPSAARFLKIKKALEKDFKKLKIFIKVV
jgi:DNA polymerase